jgi:hypothetical protein
MTAGEQLLDLVRQVMAAQRGSLTPQEWARLLAASRAGLVAALADEGIPPERGERLVDEWDAEARRCGLSPETTGYWDQAPGWIREQARTTWLDR